MQLIINGKKVHKGDLKAMLGFEDNSFEELLEQNKQENNSYLFLQDSSRTVRHQGGKLSVMPLSLSNEFVVTDKASSRSYTVSLAEGTGVKISNDKNDEFVAPYAIFDFSNNKAIGNTDWNWAAFILLNPICKQSPYTNEITLKPFLDISLPDNKAKLENEKTQKKVTAMANVFNGTYKVEDMRIFLKGMGESGLSLNTDSVVKQKVATLIEKSTNRTIDILNNVSEPEIWIKGYIQEAIDKGVIVPQANENIIVWTIDGSDIKATMNATDAQAELINEVISDKNKWLPIIKQGLAGEFKSKSDPVNAKKLKNGTFEGVI